MRKGFSIIEIIICLMFVSVCLLCLTSILTNVNLEFSQSNKFINNSQRLKTIETMLSNEISKNNDQKFILNNNTIYIDGKIFLESTGHEVEFKNDNIVIYKDIIDEIELIIVNEHLLKINLTLGDINTESYYYIGGKVYES